MQPIIPQQSTPRKKRKTAELPEDYPFLKKLFYDKIVQDEMNPLRRLLIIFISLLLIYFIFVR